MTRFHLAAPVPHPAGYWLVAFRDTAKPGGGTASGRTADQARESAWASCAETLASERAGVGR